MHTGDSKEIVSHAYPGDAYKSYIYIGLCNFDWKQVPSSAVLVAF